MLFNSVPFLFGFLPATLLLFYLAARWQGARAALGVLVLASLFFYGWWEPAFLWLILGSVGFNLLIGRSLRARPARSGRALLTIGVSGNLALLGWFKYAGFLSLNLRHMGLGLPELVDITLPIGISFYTFQQIAYLVDVYRAPPHRPYRALDYSLFVVFFPQLIAGPIVHHRQVLPQFARASTFSPQARNVAIGLSIFMLGLGKKLLIADPMATQATPIFEAAEAGMRLDALDAWRGTLAYSLQLYFDFSGYSDMAIGLARLFGIRLPLNFDAPYRARNIIDFWRRWHITLSHFLRDYLYIPLGGNRQGPWRRHVNLMITMLLGGLWHGASWNFVLWGGLHGLYLVINHLWQRLGPRPRFGALGLACSRLLTLFAVCMAWVLFRAETFDGAMAMYAAMLTLPPAVGELLGPVAPVLTALGFNYYGGWIGPEDYQLMLALPLGIALLWLLPTTQQIMRRARPALGVWPHLGPRRPLPYWAPTPAWGVALGLLATANILCLHRVSEFLYFQF